MYKIDIIVEETTHVVRTGGGSSSASSMNLWKNDVACDKCEYNKKCLMFADAKIEWYPLGSYRSLTENIGIKKLECQKVMDEVEHVRAVLPSHKIQNIVEIAPRTGFLAGIVLEIKIKISRTIKGR